jgi:uncharacterized protein
VPSHDGVCDHYDKDSKLCRIYATRPLICRVDEGYKLFAHALNPAEYMALNLATCEKLQKGNDYAKQI